MRSQQRVDVDKKTVSFSQIQIDLIADPPLPPYLDMKERVGQGATASSQPATSLRRLAFVHSARDLRPRGEAAAGRTDEEQTV